MPDMCAPGGAACMVMGAGVPAREAAAVGGRDGGAVCVCDIFCDETAAGPTPTPTI